MAVGIQYRLGLFGFLAGEKVHKAGALNVGLCTYLGSRQESQDGNLTRYFDTVDQQVALQWVQKYVSYYQMVEFYDFVMQIFSFFLSFLDRGIRWRPE